MVKMTNLLMKGCRPLEKLYVGYRAALKALSQGATNVAFTKQRSETVLQKHMMGLTAASVKFRLM